MAKKSMTIKTEREMRKIDEEAAKKIISESKDDFKKTIEGAFEAAGITEFEFFLLTVLYDIREKLSEIEKAIT